MKLLALVESPEHVCCRYRIRAFAPALERSGGSLVCEGLERNIASRVIQLAGTSRYDAVILQRKLLAPWQLAILRRSARRLVFDFDDAVLFRDSNDPRGPDDRRRCRRFEAVMRAADAVIAGNDFLADCALRLGARAADVHVIPTCVEPERYPMARHEAADVPTNLVWIGSSSTLRGLEQAMPVWNAVAKEIPGVRLRVICDRFPAGFPIPIVAVRWSEADEARQLAEAQIGISWLPDDVWSRGKCGLKVLQYQAAGLPVVGNPVGCQDAMIQPGVNGFLASDPEAWVDAIQALVEDVGLRRRMGLAARRSVEADYSVAAWSSAFVQATTGVSQPSSPSRRERPLACTPKATRSRSVTSLELVGGS